MDGTRPQISPSLPPSLPFSLAAYFGRGQDGTEARHAVGETTAVTQHECDGCAPVALGADGADGLREGGREGGRGGGSPM